MKPTPSVLMRSNLFNKTNHTINSVAKNTSCSRGWLRLVVQAIFGVVIVASFILIILMAMQPTQYKSVGCRSSMCRVTCSNSDYDEEEIATVVMDAERECPRVHLILREHTFENKIIPSRWLENVPPYIDTLSIIGGNMENIDHNAFMSQFGSHLKVLILEHVQISLWSPDTLVGLPELDTIRIRHTNIIKIEGDALRAIDDTIKSVTITGNGQWNPAFVTGSSHKAKLTVVDLSSNDFSNILGPHSFTGLESCQDLYLNSCKISSIRLGAFDSLKSIKMLYLNDNFMLTIPPGLFNNIIKIETVIKPRINLQNNLWHCDCTQDDILQLSRNDLLLVDPLCRHPVQFHGIPFSGLEEFCRNNTDNVYSHPIEPDRESVIEYNSTNKCFFGSQALDTSHIKILSPLLNFECPDNSVINFDIQAKRFLEGTTHNVDIANSSWLNPHFILKYNSYSMMQIGKTHSDSAIGFGLLWYKSECPNEMYCFNIMPDILRLYNVDSSVQYTFCPFQLHSDKVVIDHCVNYNLSDELQPSPVYHAYQRPLMYAATGVLCLLLGAFFVYSIIRMNPYLLKGSKRLLFVKHRTVDALVLPPKVPMRNSLRKEMPLPEANYGNKKIYTVSDDGKLVLPAKFVRSDSIRSDKSSSPTYISAMQPSEAQLAEWRIRHHFDKNVSLTSYTSDVSAYSLVSDPYDNISQTYVAYESMK